jgi:DNA-binding beta-propeller fold protein YncE
MENINSMEVIMKHRILLVSVVLAGIVLSITVMSTFAAAPASAPASTSADTGPLKVLKRFKAGDAGGWDYLTVDSKTKRLYVSHSNSVVVLDANNGTPIGTIADTPGVHGIALIPDSNEGYTSNGRENKIGVFDLKTLKTVRKVDSGRNPDSIIYDPATKKVISFNHTGGDITMVDTTAPDKAPVTIPVGGTLEAGVSDNAGHVYVNVEDKNEIVAVDSKEGKVLAHWPIAPGEGPTGLAIDREHHRLFAGCENQMIVVDATSGKVLATVPIGSGCDGVTFEPSLGLVVTSNGGNGTATVVKEEPAGTFKVVQTLSTARGARTITSDPVSHLIYLPCNVMVNGQSQFSVIVVGAVKP